MIRIKLNCKYQETPNWKVKKEEKKNYKIAQQASTRFAKPCVVFFVL